MTEPRILIVEDENIVALDIRNRLTKSGYVVIGIAATGESAVKQAFETLPDLILMDIQLKGVMDGIEAASRIRSLKSIPVIYLTAHSDRATLERAKITEPYGYIIKPFDDRELHTTIEMGLYKNKTERKLMESESRLSATLKCMGDAVLVIDTEGLISYMNPMAEALTGWSHKSTRGENYESVFRVLDEKSRNSITPDILKTLNKREVTKMPNDIRLVTRSGQERPIEGSVAPVIDPQEESLGLVLLFRDISEKKQAEKDKAALEVQIRHTQKMEAVGTLAGGIAHDFNNILSSMIGYSELALMDTDEESGLNTYLKEIFKAGGRAKELVQQILTFSRENDDKLRPLFLNSIVNEVMKLLRATLPSNIEIKTNLDSCSMIIGNPTQIHQVLMNLCTNAGHAMACKGGMLTVALSDITVSGPQQIECQDLSPGQHVMLSVRDTGSGISPHIIESIFDPYFTTKEMGEGTGLGLSVVRGIVKSHGGGICVFSEMNKGSEFKVYFPAVEEASDTAVESSQTQPIGTEKILLVDDESVIAELLKLKLERLGYRVDARTDSMKALELFKGAPEEFDLVITDMTMPGMTGDRLSMECINIRPDIPIILCTGYSNQIDEERARDIGIKEFMMKPVTMNDLAARIRNILNA